MVMFKFKDFDYLTDGVIDLKIKEKVSPNFEKGYVPTYKYIITLHGSDESIGTINMRVGMNDNLYYVGNIGYGIDEPFRGNHYAARACNIIKDVAVAHDMNQVIITCNPDNLPSRRTCEKVGLTLLEIVDIPPHVNLYQIGERQKCIYEWNLA